VRLIEGCEDWIRGCVAVRGPIEVTHERPWATVMRVSLASGYAWFKACAPVEGFEPRMTARLFERWPDRLAEVLAYDEDRGWLLLADAGTPISATGNQPEDWLAVLPRYAELQRGETFHVADHLAHQVPDLRLATLPSRYETLVTSELPLAPDEVGQLRRFGGQFADLCQDLADQVISDTVQHDDLHAWNVYRRHNESRVLDWGDASISHPFVSLVVTFRFLRETNGLSPTDPWFARLRDAYLEPWGHALAQTFALAFHTRVHELAAYALALTAPDDGHVLDLSDVAVVQRQLEMSDDLSAATCDQDLALAEVPIEYSWRVLRELEQWAKLLAITFVQLDGDEPCARLCLVRVSHVLQYEHSTIRYAG
jgi:Phosphotransferase enzyme family